MRAQVIVLNGGSSAGKSTLAVHLQRHLRGTWLRLGVDDLIRAMSHGPEDTTVAGTLHFGEDGTIVVGEDFYAAQESWYSGLAAIARAGTGVIVDEVFLGGGRSQAPLRRALEGLVVLWVGVRCHPDVAEARERRRGDRVAGMARDQADRVHAGVAYDVVVDTTGTPAEACADAVMASVSRTGS